MKRKSLLIMLLAALFMPLALHAQQVLPYEYSFENQDLTIDGWTTSNLIDGSEIMQLYNSGDNLYVFAFFYTTNPPQYLISPLLTSTENGVSVEFQYACYRTNWGDETFQVGYSTTTDAIDSFTWGTEITASNSLYDGDDWLTYENNFPAGTKYVAIKHTSYDRFYFLLDNFSFAAPDACPKPTGLTVDNITGHTATLNWNSTSGSTWQICINDDESHLITTSQNPYTLTGLNAETDYTVKVRTKCSNTDISNWTNNLAFTTDVACPAPGDLAATDITSTSANITWAGSASNYNLRYKNFIFIEDFESGSLNNWTTVRNGEGNEYTDWRVVNSENAFSSGSIPAHSGVYVAMSRSWSGDPYSVDNWLITPQVTLDGTLKFWVLDDGEYHEHFDVYVSTATNNINDFTLLYEPGDATDTWSEITVDLSSFGGVSGYIAIRNEDNDKDYLFIDDFVIYYPAVEWTTINNATSPCPISGLTPETAYQIQVQAVCGGQDGSSVWTSTSFTTLPSCVAPTDLTISNITTNSAVVTWTGSARSYNLKVNDQTYNNVTSPYTLSNLTTATVYTVEVQSVCSATSTSTWTSTEFVTELCEEADKCEIFYELTDSYGDGWNGAYIFVVDDATNVLIDYWTVGDSIASGSLLVCNGRQINFLWYSGNYDDECSWVITDVNGDQISIGDGDNYIHYATIKSYTVDCTITSCRYPTNLTVTDFTATSANLTWTENGDATSWVVSYTVGATGRERTINATTNLATIPNLTPGTPFTAKVRPVCDVDNRWSEPITFTIPNNLFINDGNWNVGSNWYNGAVPADSSNVGIIANAIVPANYLAIAGDVIISDAGSITVADGGQLVHNTFGLEVTMQKYVPAYTSSQDNYKLVAFPFIDDELEVPAGMTLVANDFYLFDNSQAGEEWQNNKENAITNVELYKGYLYANPTATTVSMTGTTYNTPKYRYGHPQEFYYDDTENEVNGWYLLGNPYTSNAYIYGATSELFPMEVMYYDANGDMQTIVGGPVPPMQGFFVKITEDTDVWFLASEYDLSSKAALRAINDKKASQDVNLDKKADKNVTILDKTMVKKLAKKDAIARFKNEVMLLKPIKK